MIRSLLMAAGFLIVTIALLFLQPSPPRPDADPTSFETAPVTRAETATGGSFGLTEPQAEPAASAPVIADAQPQPDAANAPATSVKPRQRPALAQPRSFEVPESGDPIQNQVAMMTRNILEELRTAPGSQVRTTHAASTPATTETFEVQLRAADLSGASDADLKRMLRDGAVQGTLTVDAAFLTTQGEIDVAALLAYFAPDRAPISNNTVTQDFLYRVQPGDSIGGLAIAFYGDVKKHDAITAANTGVLGLDARISTGQLLTVPAL